MGEWLRGCSNLMGILVIAIGAQYLWSGLS